MYVDGRRTDSRLAFRGTSLWICAAHEGARYKLQMVGMVGEEKGAEICEDLLLMQVTIRFASGEESILESSGAVSGWGN